MPKGFAVECKDSGAMSLDIYDEIGGWFGVSSRDVIASLREAGDKIKTIKVAINSPGGVVFDGLAIYNELKAHKANVVVTVQGLAASAASIIAMAGDTIRMGEGSFLMVHNASGLVYGEAGDMRSMADSLDKVSGELAGIYARRCGKSVDDVRALMDSETWYTASEAVEEGFADESIADEYDETKRMAASASQLFAQYRNTPKTFEFRATRIENRASVAVGAGEIPQEEGNAMSNPEKETAAPPVEARAATFKELTAALPKATADFLCEQMGREATLDQARNAWTEHLQAALEAKDAAMEQAVAEAKAAAHIDKPGVEPLATINGPQVPEDADPIVAWDKAVQVNMDRGMDRAKATSAAVKSNPELHAAFLDAVNAERGSK